MSLELPRALLLPATLLLLAFVCPLAARAQNPQPSPTPLTAPPPLKLISKEEHQQLDQTKDAKERLKLSIELAGAHLTKAEQLTMQTEYEAALNEVGTYNALIEDALENLSALKQDSNKTRDLYKRLELALRGRLAFQSAQLDLVGVVVKAGTSSDRPLVNARAEGSASR